MRYTITLQTNGSFVLTDIFGETSFSNLDGETIGVFYNETIAEEICNLLNYSSV